MNINNAKIILLVAGSMAFAFKTQANPIITNYVNGFEYSNATKDQREYISVTKNLNEFIINMKLTERNNDNFTAFVVEDDINKVSTTNGVFSAISDALALNLPMSKIDINYNLSKHELLHLYGKESLLLNEMERCRFENLQLSIKTEYGNYNFNINDNHKITLTPNELHLLSFCK